MKKVFKNRKIVIIIIFLLLIFYHLVAINKSCGGLSSLQCLPGYFCVQTGSPVQPDGAVVIISDSGTDKCVLDFGL